LSIKTCYICGEAPGPTKDHVFPKCLFVPPLPVDMITAPACRACQQDIQPDEEVFRNFVAAGSYGDATARALWEGKVAGSFENSPGLRTTFINSMKTIEWKSPGGVILGDLTVDSGEQVMPFNVRYHIEQITPMTEPLPEQVMVIIHGIDVRTVGDDVRYKFQIVDDEPRATVSWLAFYGKMQFFVMTWPEDAGPPTPAVGSDSRTRRD
jgi:hypothetical protein